MDASILNQLILAFVMIIPIILIARSVVAGTKYSPILIIVVFGLFMGLILQLSGVAEPGLPEFSLVTFMSKATVIVLIVAFFVGGQEIKKMISKKHLDIEELVTPSEEEVILGTKRTQLFFIVRAFFILLGIQAAYLIITGNTGDGGISEVYPVLAYIGIMFSIILIDPKKIIRKKQSYLLRGSAEMAGILMVLIFSYLISNSITTLIPLPQIFFAMLISCGLGLMAPKWRFGPTIRALLFAGIPIVLAATFLIGGSRMIQAFGIEGMTTIIGYGFFGQLLWMFGGIALLIMIGRANHVRNIAPGMAGSLSHSGLTGACTAGDLGTDAAARAPIMINVPFFGHLFVFTILAYSAAQGYLEVLPCILVLILGIVLTWTSLKRLRTSKGEESLEVKGLMIFCLGWQLTAVFGSFLLQHFAGVAIWNSAMGASSAISHFGLFAAVQGNMFGHGTADLIPFIFAMPFLVHPLVFWMFGRAMENEGKMSVRPVYVLTAIGLIGTILSFWFL